MLEIILLLAGVVGGSILALLVSRSLQARRENTALQSAEAKARQLLADAEARDRELLVHAKEESLKMRSEAEAATRELHRQVRENEQQVAQREEGVLRKLERLEEREGALGEERRRLEEARQLAESLTGQRMADLERISHLTQGEARGLLMTEVEAEVREEANRLTRKILDEARDAAGPHAQEILTASIQRLASEAVSEATVSVVQIPNEDMKGRIIGREGRNIRAIEQATGVDLVIDDTPDAVMLSSFDGVKREVARLALTRLISDGRIQPSRIEEVVRMSRKDVDKEMAEAAKDAVRKANITGLHPEVMQTLGKLKYRTSYGQNQLLHSVETGQAGSMIGKEVGCNVEVLKYGAFLHDLGKALDRDYEGTHAALGAAMARRCGIPEPIAHCIESHHEEVSPGTIEALLVQVADSISGGRPGARMEALESYIKRLQDLERIATGFEGVDSAFAIQAGREVRIIVRPDKVDDLGAMRIARDVSKQIEETMEYPGQVRVTVVRETRASDIAR